MHPSVPSLWFPRTSRHYEMQLDHNEAYWCADRQNWLLDDKQHWMFLCMYLVLRRRLCRESSCSDRERGGTEALHYEYYIVVVISVVIVIIIHRHHFTAVQPALKTAPSTSHSLICQQLSGYTARIRRYCFQQQSVDSRAKIQQFWTFRVILFGWYPLWTVLMVLCRALSAATILL